MLELLIKAFIKDKDRVGDAVVRRQYGTLCSCWGIVLNVLLFAGKYFAGLLSGSVAIIADAFNNLSDAGSSIITLLGFAVAGKKPDPDHPYGHGRAEYLTGLVLSALILVMGFELAKTSFEKILHPQSIEVGILPALILVASIFVKFYMSSYNKRIGKRINSAAMLATSADSLSDAISTAVVLLSMGVTWLFKINIDAYAGLAVALFILYAGYGALKDTLSPLLGEAPDAETVQRVEEIVLAHPEIVGIHDMIFHDYGPGRSFVSLHAEVDGSGDVFLLHDAIDNAEMELRRELGIHATIHLDPIDTKNPELAALREGITGELHKLCPEASIHDLRVVPGATHTNVIFDALFPMNYEKTDAECATQLRHIVSGNWPDHFAVVTIDRDYTGKK